MDFRSNKSGLILAEALVAVTTLLIATVVVTGIIKSSLEATSLSRSYLIAQNLATEAIEGVKSFRDTNWLKAPTAHPECWMVLDLAPNSEAADCGEGVPKMDVAAGEGDTSSYVITNTEDGWEIEGDENNSLEELDDAEEAIEADGDASVDSSISPNIGLIEGVNMNILLLVDIEIYLVFPGFGLLDLIPEEDLSAGNYYRGVQVLSMSEESAEFEVSVSWVHKNKSRNIVRRFTIYNFR
jgi:hypothetical protein